MTTCDTSSGGGGGLEPAVAAHGHLTPAARSSVRLGLFGGSFDPVHQGHLDVAAAARAAHRLDHVVFVPAALSPHKAGLPPAPGAARVALLERALAGKEVAPWASVWTVELLRPPPSFTVATLATLRDERPRGSEPYLILGEDNLAGLPSWRAVGELLSCARPLVVQREPATCLVDRVEAIADALPPAAVARLLRGLVPLDEPSPHSSTGVRAALAAGRDPGPALPPGLWELIGDLDLYGCGRAD